MTHVFESCVEPGELDDTREAVECPACKRTAIARRWEACETGAINVYTNTHCTHCNFFKGDTGEDGEYDHVFETDRDEQHAEDQVFNLANLNWLSTGDFLTFAAGIRQAA
ncbi:hypothetical protein K5E40_27945 [Pseudomonas baetica]|uniref:hypothetical protein n=1 Tax=Pseudomonas baetica TaxID=674054 RepID=UPI001C8BCA56|nr:hypothetical protein [Pseudomonas baetica]MBX9409495.1 hypothetical protein [Pseudomonas baetica]